MPIHLPILFAESPVGTILLGVLILFVAFLMRRAGMRKRRSSDENTAEVVRREYLAHQAGRKEVEKLELRLHDFAREVDALAQTRIAVLTELVAAADRAIIELEKRTATGELTAEQRRMIALLSQAGYDAGEIATLIRGRQEDVNAVLIHGDDRSGSQAA
jgi:hypothetical protein